MVVQTPYLEGQSNYEKPTKLGKKIVSKKILHTGDKASLDRCGY